uniref:Receptor expression enhancing protein A, isoform P n=1 Tax=Drosophila melanogaster TaxID=7227 RepID=A0A0B4JCV3_DROME|nr:receptor expression enhancing protein A, isoform P [Drosophila melanogaster]ADV37236.2 receptor expression enhancing protein A, isoform P [Drosophila melanogaster]|eukprot:NP_001188990.2 receptor expression enhancing protein 1, isoform P [Drosophila melanogaster]
MISSLFSRLIILFCGTLYPAYASYKAVRTKDVKEYVKWMMYWIVFAFFTCIETFTDIFISWLPFYYEVKVALVFWLLSPATKGSSTLYRKFVHPMLTRHEQEIDEYVNQAKERGYSAVLQLGSKGVNYATNVLMQTAIKGGGNLVQTIKRSYSLSDLSEPDMHRTQDELDDVMMSSMTSSAVVMRSTATGARLLRPRNQTPVGRSGSGTRHSTGMYFTEVDVTAKNAGDFNYNIRSQDDISSGYSSAEPVSGLSRTSSMTNASKARAKSKRNELLEEMRDEVYLDNQLYFQGVQRKSSVPEAEELKIVESSESIQSQELEKVLKEENIDAEDEAFFETLPLIEEHINEVVANYGRDEKLLPQERKHNSIEEEQFEDALFEEPQKCVSDEVDAKNIEEILTDRSQNQTPNGSAETTDSGTPSQNKPYVHPPIDPFLLVLSASASAPDPFMPERPRPMSPREMRETLEEIKHSFRAQLEAEPSVSASPSPSLRPKANHGKGRAPPPPLPPKKHSLSPQPDAISQTSTGSVERKSGQIHVC